VRIPHNGSLFNVYTKEYIWSLFPKRSRVGNLQLRGCWIWLTLRRPHSPAYSVLKDPLHVKKCHYSTSLKLTRLFQNLLDWRHAWEPITARYVPIPVLDQSLRVMCRPKTIHYCKYNSIPLKIERDSICTLWSWAFGRGHGLRSHIEHNYAQ
jgi:hypothetical protein